MSRILPTLEAPMIVPAREPGAYSIAQILAGLGGVGPDRVYSLGRPATTDDLFQLRATRPTQRFELVDGFLVEKPMGLRESYVGAMLSMILLNFVTPRNLGVVAGADGLLALGADVRRIPDVHYTAWANLPHATAHLERVGHYPADLAVEILSPSNTAEEMARKTRDYFSAGTQLVWIVDPDTQTIAVYAQPESPTILGLNDTLEGGVVLPGFTLVLADFFRLPQLNPRS